MVLHAKVTVRDSIITAHDGGQGGDGGEPEEGGKGGWGMPGGAVGDGTWSCGGGGGGLGGDGGYGGPGRGGDSIGIAYLDEDQLTLEGVTFELGPPGPGGTSWDWSGDVIRGRTASPSRRFASLNSRSHAMGERHRLPRRLPRLQEDRQRSEPP